MTVPIDDSSERELLTINEAARELHIRAIDVRRLLQAHKLTAMRNHEGQWCIPTRDLRGFLVETGGVRRSRGNSHKMSVNVRELAQTLSESGTEAHEVLVPVPGKGVQRALLVAGIGFFPSWEWTSPKTQLW